uniref:Thioredoxin domain-containing protein n=1 Tax=Heterosigma akashiwo TaxID=2829 RepID=A0A6T5PLF6_HETAK
MKAMQLAVALCLALCVAVFGGKIAEEHPFEIEDGVHIITNEGEYRMMAKDPHVWAIMAYSEREERCTTCPDFTPEFHKMAKQTDDVYFAKFKVDKPGGMALGHKLLSYEAGFPNIKVVNKEWIPSEIGLFIHDSASDSIEKSFESLNNILGAHTKVDGGFLKHSQDQRSQDEL